MNIKVKYSKHSCIFNSIKKGEYIDLKAAENITLKAPYVKENGNIKFYSTLVPLGVSMNLPKYFEAVMVPRSSSYSKFNFIMSNSEGIIDSSYCGNEDIWKCPIIALGKVIIKEGNRICQFRIRPSQFAPWYVKLKWLFTSKINFTEVQYLNETNRGGFGTTGI